MLPPRTSSPAARTPRPFPWQVIFALCTVLLSALAVQARSPVPYAPDGRTQREPSPEGAAETEERGGESENQEDPQAFLAETFRMPTGHRELHWLAEFREHSRDTARILTPPPDC